MIELQINGTTHSVETPDDMPLLWVLRDLLGITGTKFGCGRALCGACTVLLDGSAIRSCVTPVAAATKRAITTIEGAGGTRVGRSVQAAWSAIDVPQCGYCQSGQIMSAISLLNRTPKPSATQIKQGMAGNVCRCGTYNRIQAAIRKAVDDSSP